MTSISNHAMNSSRVAADSVRELLRTYNQRKMLFSSLQLINISNLWKVEKRVVKAEKSSRAGREGYMIFFSNLSIFEIEKCFYLFLEACLVAKMCFESF